MEDDAPDVAATAPGGGPGIGPRLRAARVARRRTVEEVAAASGMTKGFLSRLERDRANASVAALVRLCATLDIAVGSLFEPAPAGQVVRAGEYPPITFGGTGLREFLVTPRGEARLGAIVSEIEPGGGSGDEPYALPGDVEIAVVLEGELVLDFADPTTGTVVLRTGDVFTFAPTEPHTFRCGGAGARVLWVISPALPDGARGRG